MEKKKSTQVPQSTVTRDLDGYSQATGNIYKSVVVMAKRANQIAQQQKQDLEKRLQEFTTYSMPGEDTVVSEEQVEISRFYEKMPKPTLIAAKEYADAELCFRDNKESEFQSTSVDAD